ncbi:uncharacterized protein METZ01_LOCUS416609, partial [marine metagenome]
MKKIILLLIVFCLGFSADSENSNKFTYNKLSSNLSSLELEINLESTIEVGGYKKITNTNSNHTIEPGFPELPTHTAFYQVDPGKEYEVELVVYDSYLIENMVIYPHQGANKGGEPFLINNDFYLSEGVYPENNLMTSERMHSRGFDLISIEVIPYNFYPATNSLEVFTNIEILIHEVGQREEDVNLITKRSRIFDSLLENYVINFQSSDREEDYQNPSILYICGGSSCNYLNNLFEWRHEQGYIVNTASLGETGSSAS